MTIGEKIAAYRKTENLTQAAFADKVFSSQQMINAIEHGITMPGLELAFRIAETLGCTVDELCKEAKEG